MGSHRPGSTGRTLRTADRALADAIHGAVLVTARDVEDQRCELAAAGFALGLPDEPVRCGTCNARLVRVAPDEPTPAYALDPAGVVVWRCPDCGQHVWRGSHRDDVARTLGRPETGDHHGLQARSAICLYPRRSRLE